MNILVTGGAGFIGSHLTDTLIARGHEVRVVDDLSTGLRSNIASEADFIEGDLAESEVAEAATAGIEVVFHQAAIGSVPRSIDAPRATDRANVHGTLSLLDAAVRAGVRRVVAASSSSVYGGTVAPPIREDAPFIPRSPYAVSKAAGEMYLRVFAEVHRLETIALRYFNVFGPRQRHDSGYAAVIPRWIDALRQGEQPHIHGDGLQTRDFTFVDDAVAANLAAAEVSSDLCDGRAYNVSGGSQTSLLDLVDGLRQVLGGAVEPTHGPERPGDVRHSAADISAAARDLGWVPKVGLYEGLQRMTATSYGANTLEE